MNENTYRNSIPVKRVLLMVMTMLLVMGTMTACEKKMAQQLVSKEDVKELIVQGITYGDVELKNVDKENKTAKVEISYPDVLSIVKKNPLLLADKSKLKMEMAKAENKKTEEIEVKVIEQDGKWTVDASIDQNELLGKFLDEVIEKVFQAEKQ